MDAASLLRSMGSLGAVLGLLLLALWATRRYNIRLPGAVGVQGTRRLAVVERVALDPRRSVALIRRDGCEHLLLISPEGHQMLESGIAAPLPAPAAAADFASLVDAVDGARARPSPARDAAAVLQLIAARLASFTATLRCQLARAQPWLARGEPAPAPAAAPRRPARAKASRPTKRRARQARQARARG